jgi:hypothetical protein
MTMPPPYPADTRAKGWRFELDAERIQQSDTWALAEPQARPWLLMLWLTAWQQTPCGSLPADERILCARLGVDRGFWSEHREVLLRGWWLADDGRLYHPVIAQQVAAMLQRKDDERRRKADYRARMDAERRAPSADVPRDNHGTVEGRTRESGGSDATGTGTGTSNTNTGGVPPDPPARATRAREAPPDPPPWVDGVAWRDFVAMRTRIRKPLTAAACRLAFSELAKLRDGGHDPTEVLRQSTFRGWAGLFAVKADDGPQGRAQPPSRRAAEAAKWIPQAPPRPPGGVVIDMEGGHGPRREVG